MVGMLPFGVGQWQSSARRGAVPGHTGVYHGTNEHRTNTHDRVDHPRASRDRSTPSRELVCPQHRAPRGRRSRLLRGVPGSWGSREWVWGGATESTEV